MPPNSGEIARRQLGDTLNRKQNDSSNQWLSEEDFVKVRSIIVKIKYN